MVNGDSGLLKRYPVSTKKKEFLNLKYANILAIVNILA